MLATQVLSLCHELMDARADAEHHLAVMKRQLGRMTNNVSHLINRPTIMQ